MERTDISALTGGEWGFRVGQSQDLGAATGCTVILHEEGAVCGVDVRGGSPGTRDTDALQPTANRKVVHGILLAGGSSFGLDAAGGVMRFLEERGVGRDVAVARVPNVCAAILFDLKCGSPNIRPDAEMGYVACRDAYENNIFHSGNFGAGTGCTIGKSRGIEYAMKGGIGCSVLRHGDLITGAIAAVNCVGDVTENGAIIAGALADSGAFANSEDIILSEYQLSKDFFSGNTVLGCILTNARLDKNGAAKLAAHGQNGIARAIRPAHSVFDGDTVFALCSGHVSTTLDAAGILSAAAMEEAIIDAVKSARSYGGYRAMCDLK